MRRTIFFFSILILCFQSFGQKPRATDPGIPFEGNTGPYNAITDVGGVEVGFTTIIKGTGSLKVGEGPA